MLKPHPAATVAAANAAMTHDVMESLCTRWLCPPTTGVTERGAREEPSDARQSMRFFDREWVLPMHQLSLVVVGVALAAIMLTSSFTPKTQSHGSVGLDWHVGMALFAT
jgi:hypothetical protein